MTIASEHLREAAGRKRRAAAELLSDAEMYLKDVERWRGEAQKLITDANSYEHSADQLEREAVRAGPPRPRQLTHT